MIKKKKIGRPKGSKNKTSEIVEVTPTNTNQAMAGKVEEPDYQLMTKRLDDENYNLYQYNAKLTKEISALKLQNQAMKDAIACLSRVINNEYQRD